MDAYTANIWDKETEAAGTITIYSSSGIKEDGSKEIICDGQGRHRKN